MRPPFPYAIGNRGIILRGQKYATMHDPQDWTPLRRRFEAFRKMRDAVTGSHERIPESLVRDAIAEQLGIKPEDVTWKQIQFAVSGLLSDYPAIIVVPTEKAPSQRDPSIALPPATQPLGDTEAPDAEIHRRKGLLSEYKAATGEPSNKRIYEATNSEIHKPQFHRWLRGLLPVDSATTINFERFLREKRPPIPRKR